MNLSQKEVNVKNLVLLALTFCTTLLLWAKSGEEQAARQARSVHLQYRKWNAPAQVLYIEATPEQSAPGTYFCLLGFDVGYCGIQDLIDGTRIGIFSIWEPSHPHAKNTNDEKSVHETNRTQLLYQGENVHIQRFGGEGTGGKSMIPLKWELNKPVCMAVSAEPNGESRSAYTCWIWDDSKADWFRMATFSTLFSNGKHELNSAYSFVEDFRRNIKSKDAVRKARFSRLWAYNGSIWTACANAAFTADNNTLTTIDAGATENGFWLATGGTTTNATTQLLESITPKQPSDDSAERRARLISLIEALKAPQPPKP